MQKFRQYVFCFTTPLLLSLSLNFSRLLFDNLSMIKMFGSRSVTVNYLSKSVRVHYNRARQTSWESETSPALTDMSILFILSFSRWGVPITRMGLGSEASKLKLVFNRIILNRLVNKTVQVLYIFYGLYSSFWQGVQFILNSAACCNIMHRFHFQNKFLIDIWKCKPKNVSIGKTCHLLNGQPLFVEHKTEKASAYRHLFILVL